MTHKSSSDHLSNWFLGWMPFTAYTLLILYFSILPYEQLPKLFLTIEDIFSHILMYFVFYFFSVNAFKKSHVRPLNKAPRLYAFWWCVVIGALLELAQRQIPGRYATWADVMANTAGAAMAWVAYHAIYSKQKDEA